MSIDVFISSSVLCVTGTGDANMVIEVPLTASLFNPFGGPSANRPLEPQLGQFYYDTDLSQSLKWDGNFWENDKGEVSVLRDTGMELYTWQRKATGIIPNPGGVGGTDSQDITIWLNQSENQIHPNRSFSSTLNPKWDFSSNSLEFDSSELRFMHFPKDGSQFFGDKKLLVGVVYSGSTFEFGAGAGGTPPPIFRENEFVWNGVTLSWSGIADKQVLIYGFDGTNLFVRRDGTQVDSDVGSAFYPATTTFVTLGRTSTATYMDGNIYEFFVLRSSTTGGAYPTTSQIEEIESYLMGL